MRCAGDRFDVRAGIASRRSENTIRYSAARVRTNQRTPRAPRRAAPRRDVHEEEEDEEARAQIDCLVRIAECAAAGAAADNSFQETWRADAGAREREAADRTRAASSIIISHQSSVIAASACRP